VELKIGFVAAGFGLGSFVGSLFGMNLASGLEELAQPYLFWGVVATTTAMVIIMYRLLTTFT